MGKPTRQIKKGGVKKAKGKSALDVRIARLRKLPKYKTPAYMNRETKIQAALEAYHDPDDTDITSLRIAAGVFDGVAYSTLRDRNQSAVPTKNLADNGGYNKKLNEAQETALIWYVDSAIERGFPMRYDMIVAAATRILVLSAIAFTAIGLNWARRWVERMDEAGRYHALRTTPMDQKRKDCMTIEGITGCFNKLALVMAKFGVHWKDIFNVDEIGFRVGCIRSGLVITHKRIKQVRILHLISMFNGVLT